MSPLRPIDTLFGGPSARDDGESLADLRWEHDGPWLLLSDAVPVPDWPFSAQQVERLADSILPGSGPLVYEDVGYDVLRVRRA